MDVFFCAVHVSKCVSLTTTTALTACWTVYTCCCCHKKVFRLNYNSNDDLCWHASRLICRIEAQNRDIDSLCPSGIGCQSPCFGLQFCILTSKRVNIGRHCFIEIPLPVHLACHSFFKREVNVCLRRQLSLQIMLKCAFSSLVRFARKSCHWLRWCLRITK